MEIIGYIAAICTTIGFIPQLARILKTKSVNDISLTMCVIMIIGSILWFIYGLLKNTYPLMLSGGITLIIISFILILRIKWGVNNEK